MTLRAKARDDASGAPVFLAVDEAAAFLLGMAGFALSTIAGSLAAPFGFLGLGVGWFLILKRQSSPLRVVVALALTTMCLMLRVWPSL